MASFENHIQQANWNLSFLDTVDNNIPDYWDWKVTTLFYVAVHLMNAHLSNKMGFTYRSHKEVDHAINYLNPTSLGKVDEQTYLAYSKLQNLSRRSRYIVHESDPASVVACLTYDRHFSKALTHLDTVMNYMKSQHSVVFSKITIDCIEIQKKTFNNFSYRKVVKTA